MEGGDTELSSPNSKQGTCIVKLKCTTMPEKTVETTPEEADNSGVVEEKKSQYYCEECRKSFNSGKALGGHLSSAHVQSRKAYSLGVRKGHNSLGSPGGKYCVLCGREFSSSKALFGHMRSHPERQWRGMEPPAAVVEDSDNGGEVSAPLRPMADMASSLKGWSVTAKRGRPEITKPAAAGLQAFQKLMKFVENHKEKQNDEVEDVGSSSLVADSHQFNQQKTESAIDVAEEKHIEAETEAESTIDVAEGKLIEAETNAEAEEAEKKTQENSATSNRQNYICTTCNRSFHSHQALGGHKSSHNKLKIMIIDQTGEVPSGNNNKNNVVKRRQPSSHVCKICGTRFSSGQALGRHKRSHTEEDEKKKETERVEEFEIDLNKLPDEV